MTQDGTYMLPVEDNEDNAPVEDNRDLAEPALRALRHPKLAQKVVARDAAVALDPRVALCARGAGGCVSVIAGTRALAKAVRRPGVHESVPNEPPWRALA